MRWFDRLRLRLSALVGRRRIDADLDDELRFFLEHESERYVAAGHSPDEAQRLAARSMGRMMQVKEECRDARGLTVLDDLYQDVRIGARSLRRNPGFTLAAVTVLAVGIGASTAIFSAVNAFLFRPLPFAEADRLVMLYETNPEFGWTDAQVAPANALDWREQVDAFADVTIYSTFINRKTYVRNDQPELLGTSAVTGNFFSVLGVRPLLGRGFTWEETWQGRDDVVVLSHAAWLTHFNGEPGVVGLTIELDESPIRVIGVMPEGLGFPSRATEAWVPWGWDPAVRDQIWFRRAHFGRAVARLSDDVTGSEAEAALQVVVARLQRDFPGTNRVMGANSMALRDFLVRDVRRPMLVLLSAVAVLLLIACTNVANLMLIRASDRNRDVALRFALGAGRGRVMRQALVDGALLGLAGGTLGLGLGWTGIRALAALQPIGIAGATTLSLDLRVVLFALAVALGSALLFATAPAIRAARTNVVDGLQSAGRSDATGTRGFRTTRSLVAGQVALTLILVVGAGLMVRTALSLRAVDLGFRTASVLAVRFDIPEARYPERDQVLAFQDAIEQELEARPGIERVGLVGHLPLMGSSWSSQFQARGWPPDRVGLEILHRRADPGYFEALDIPLVRGRMFSPEDGADSTPVVVVNETFAREHFPNEDPIGAEIAYDRVATPESRWYRIVGIVGDQHQETPGQPARAEVFENRRQDWERDNWFVVRTTGDAAQATATVRSVLAEIDPLIAVADARALDDVWRASMSREEFLLILLGVFACSALLLTTVGTYGVTTQAARMRTHEIGIRVALGARSAEVLRLILSEGLAIVGLGVAIGAIIVLVTTRVMTAFLFGVEPTDPLTLAAAVALLVLVTAAACYIPARRAAALDPVASLRAD